MGEPEPVSYLVSEAVVSQGAALLHHAQRQPGPDDVEIVPAAGEAAAERVDQKDGSVGGPPNLDSV